MAGQMTGGGAFWWLAALGLSGLIAVEMTEDALLTPTVIAAVNETAASDLPPALPPMANLPPRTLVDDIAERPLFSPSRKPTSTEQPAGAGEPAEALAWELVGTMLIDDVPIALMRHPTDGFLRLRQGQEVGDWLIVNIQDETVSLEQGNRRQTLSLQKDRTKPTKSVSSSETGAAGKITNKPIKAPPGPKPPLRTSDRD